MALSDRQIQAIGRKVLLHRALPAQRAFSRSGAKRRWFFGGNRSGKSEGNIGWDLSAFALRVHPWRQTPRQAVIWAVAPTWDMVGKILWDEKIKHWIPPGRLAREPVWHNKAKDIPAEIHLDDQVRIEFKAFEQGRTAFQGRALDAIYPDEQCEHDYAEILDELDMRLIDPYEDPADAGCQRFLSWSMTPILPQAKIEEIARDPGPRDAVFFADLNDNRLSRGGHIPDEEIDTLIARMPEETQVTRVLGHFGAFVGVVYKSFRREVHVVEPFAIPADWERYRAIDLGFANPFVCLWLARGGPDRAWHVYREHYRAQERLAWHAEKIKQASGEERYIATWADHDAQDTFELAGYGLHTLPAKKDVHAGIELVQAKLKVQDNGRPLLTISRDCPNLTREMIGYRWREGTDLRDPPDDPRKKDDHGPDALRYGIESVEGAMIYHEN